jgi:hypothetical protein
MVKAFHKSRKTAEMERSAMLSQHASYYEATRTGLLHSLHCNRVLRDRTDKLRTFPDLPPVVSRRPHRSESESRKRDREPRPHHLKAV